ncbi:MAG: SUMF1/EgtB/PvdO family nonheme iron enzyme [Crocinitomicaceae bacterium]
MNKDNKINELFNQVKNQPVEASFEETKAMFLKNVAVNSAKPTSGKGQFLSIKNGLIMLGIIGVVVTSLLMLNSNNEAVEVSKDTKVSHVDYEEVISIEKDGDTTQVVLIKQQRINEFGEFEELPLLELKEQLSRELIPYQKRALTPEKRKAELSSRGYIFPKLTKDEIEANHKQKKKMMKAIIKFDKNTYAYVPSGSFNYLGKTVSIQAFIMQTKEVSNLEYRTFLFDLLIQGRKEDFKKAAPDQENWTALFGESMRHWQDNYFADHNYDNRPVVNVSVEGAEMYCFWLSKESFNYATGGEAKKKKLPYTLNDLRLPFKSEWVKAASVEGLYKDFAWGGGKPLNEDGCFLGNFDLSSFSGNLEDCDCKNRGTKDAKTTAAYIAGDDMLIADVSSYNPNEYGIYNLSGNVAEMVYDHEIGGYSKDNPQAIGGGWMSSESEISVNSTVNIESKSKGNPNVGFRVVMTYMGKNWTPREDQK